MPKMKEISTRSMVPAPEMDAFRKRCNGAGETMSSVFRKLISKVASGDQELLDRILS
jgi:hypothetical protein